MKKHTLWVIPVAILLLNTATTMAQSTTTSKSCQPNPVKATYLITQYDTDNKAVGSYPLVIYRDKTHIIYEYPQAQMADSWQLNTKKQLGMSRYFYQEKRSIDYDSADLLDTGNLDKWAKLSQLIDINQDKPSSHYEKGCFSIDQYKDAQKNVFFLPAYQLPQSMSFLNDEGKQV